MSATLIDGKLEAQHFRESLAPLVAEIREKKGRAPGLAVVRVGEDPASKVYVASKNKAAVELGFASFSHVLDASITQEALLELVDTLNNDPHVDGILVQLPLPKHIRPDDVIRRIRPEKDVDGFHPYNAGLLAQGHPNLVACTPLGVMHLLEKTGVTLKGKRCVVVGRSTIVGRPMSMLLLNASATVIMCHSQSNVRQEVENADVVVAAVGVPKLIRGDWVAKGSIVVDVGINRTPEGKLVGDVDFETARERAAFITPVPGGVGPMTVAMLMGNTVTAAQRSKI